MEKKEYYSDKEVADLLNINVETVRLLCERGNFEHGKRINDTEWIILASEFHLSKSQTQRIVNNMKKQQHSPVTLTSNPLYTHYFFKAEK